MDLAQLRDDLDGAAHFLCVYIREAHANDEWVTQDNVRDGISFAQPATDADRCGAAGAFLQASELPFPVVVDRVDDAVAKAFGAWPDRLYVLDEEGVVVYRGGVGPFGFLPGEVREFLAGRFGAPPAP